MCVAGKRAAPGLVTRQAAPEEFRVRFGELRMMETTMNRSLSMSALVAGWLALAAAWGDDSTRVGDRCMEGKQFTLSVIGDASYQGPHEGQAGYAWITCVGGGPDSPRAGSSEWISSPPAPTSFNFGTDVWEGSS